MTACGGREFVKSEWRAVPTGTEAEAARMDFLEVREQDGPTPSPPPTTDAPAPAPAVAIDLSDGVQPEEASLAGRVLQAAAQQVAAQKIAGRDISTEMTPDKAAIISTEMRAVDPAPVAPPKKKAKRK